MWTSLRSQGLERQWPESKKWRMGGVRPAGNARVSQTSFAPSVTCTRRTVRRTQAETKSSFCCFTKHKHPFKIDFLLITHNLFSVCIASLLIMSVEKETRLRRSQCSGQLQNTGTSELGFLHPVSKEIKLTQRRTVGGCRRDWSNTHHCVSGHPRAPASAVLPATHGLAAPARSAPGETVNIH